jgi:hypothetical protein
MKKIILLCVLTLTHLAFPVSSAELHWAGVGFFGNYADRNALYPNTSAVFDNKACKGISCFEDFARGTFLGQKIDGMTVVPDLANPGSNALALALGISYESFSQEEIMVKGKKSFLGNFSVFGRLVIFNLDTNQLVASVPALVRLADASDKPFTTREVASRFERLIINSGSDISFVTDALTRLSAFKIPATASTRYVQITVVEADPQAMVTMGQSKPEFWLPKLAEIFEMSLMRNTQLNLVPASVGHVVGGKMKTKLASGDRTIELPSPNLKLGLIVEKAARFEKVEGAGKTVCHATRVKFTLKDSFDDEVFDESLRSVPCSVMPIETHIDDEITFDKSVFSLVSSTAEALHKPKNNEKFFKSAAPKRAQAVASNFVKANKTLFAK